MGEPTDPATQTDDFVAGWLLAWKAFLAAGAPAPDLNGADLPPESYQKPQGFSLNVELQDATKGEHIFSELAWNGTVKMQLQETLWAQRFGVLIDRFGITWLINVGKET